MKSGLEGRNNNSLGLGIFSKRFCLNEVRPRRPEQWAAVADVAVAMGWVSMKSGLEGRNNAQGETNRVCEGFVSMKSGLEGRNNETVKDLAGRGEGGLNEVRPRRPEQSRTRKGDQTMIWASQ